MGAFEIVQRAFLRAILIIIAAIVVAGFVYLIYDISILFWHTTYWFVALFLAFILLSNILAKLVSMYLDV